MQDFYHQPYCYEELPGSLHGSNFGRLVWVRRGLVTPNVVFFRV